MLKAMKCVHMQQKRAARVSTTVSYRGVLEEGACAAAKQSKAKHEWGGPLLLLCTYMGESGKGEWAMGASGQSGQRGRVVSVHR